MNSAKAYAVAFLEVCKENNSDVESIISELKLVNDCFDSELIKFLESPKISKEEKKELFKKVFVNNQKLTDSFLKVLIDNNNIIILNEVIDEMNRIIDNEKGIVNVEVISANELSDAQVNLITAYFNTKLQKQIKISVTIDPKLVGGLVIKYEGKIIDGSLFNKHEALKEYLKK